MKGLEEYVEYLCSEELSERTVKLYYRQAQLFIDFLQDRPITKNELLAYKAFLKQKLKKATSINLYIIAVNKFLKFIGMKECTIKLENIQRRQCCDNIMNVEEYRRLLHFAHKTGNIKYYCIMKTLALTGIRISELCGCTVEALQQGKFTIKSKGKIRDIYLPDKLIVDLLNYCYYENIKTGVIFKGNRNTPITCTAVYKMLIRLADINGVPREKVHPHSFRHLFAVTYMQQYSNIFELADILGHSSVETTRIYTKTTVSEKRKKMNGLKL